MKNAIFECLGGYNAQHHQSSGSSTPTYKSTETALNKLNLFPQQASSLQHLVPAKRNCLKSVLHSTFSAIKVSSCNNARLPTQRGLFGYLSAYHKPCTYIALPKKQAKTKQGRHRDVSTPKLVISITLPTLTQLCFSSAGNSLRCSSLILLHFISLGHKSYFEEKEQGAFKVHHGSYSIYQERGTVAWCGGRVIPKPAKPPQAAACFGYWCSLARAAHDTREFCQAPREFNTQKETPAERYT